MSRLSVNINKIATLRNARGGNMPNVVKAAIDAERFGAEGITVHPRPDERHITRKDVYDLKKVVTTEFNIEGYPSREFLDMVIEVCPEQVTLVPDPPEALTSNSGWDTTTHQEKLKAIITELKATGIRTSIFVDTNLENVRGALATGTERVEFYTEPYAANYSTDKETAIAPFIKAAELANELGLGINAGHDLSLENLEYFAKKIPNLKEVSIGHALICDAIYLGFENTIQMYKRCLK